MLCLEGIGVAMFVVMLWVKLRPHGEQLVAVAPGGEDVLDH